MTTAADPTNSMHAPDILADGPTPPPKTDNHPSTVWDNEGGNHAT